MSIPFLKMHGAGNDFVVLDGRAAALNLGQAAVRWIADRRLGVGCDQLITIEPDSGRSCTATPSRPSPMTTMSSSWWRSATSVRLHRFC